MGQKVKIPEMVEDTKPKAKKKKTKPNKVNLTERRLQAWTLYQEGFTIRQIAKELKYNKSSVDRDIKFELDEWLSEQRKEASKIKIREYLKLQRLDNKIAIAFNSVGKDQQKKEDVIKEAQARGEISKLVFKLFGLDKIIVEHGDKNNYDLSSFSDAELHRIAQGEEPTKILAERNAVISN